MASSQYYCQNNEFLEYEVEMYLDDFGPAKHPGFDSLFRYNIEFQQFASFNFARVQVFFPRLYEDHNLADIYCDDRFSNDVKNKILSLWDDSI